MPINKLWKGREKRTIRRTVGHRYDWDFNLIWMDKDARGSSILYKLTDKDLEDIPNNEMEKMVHLLSSTPHQAVLILHVYIQGEFFVLIESLRKNN